MIVGHCQMYVDGVAFRRKGVKLGPGAAAQLQRRLARRQIDDADVLHEHAALEAGADRLGEGFLGGEAFGEGAGRSDGTLAPCFPMYNATHDWGTVEEPRFETSQLSTMKEECSRHCLSTCNYILSYCYDVKRVLSWGFKQALRGFQGSTGSF